MANDTNLTFLVALTEITELFSEATELFSEATDPTETELPNTTSLPSQNPSVAPTQHPLQLREESWVVPLLVLSSLNLAAVAFFEVYVLYKSCGSRRHLFLGQTLLLGLFLASLLGYAYALTPHWLLCGITRAGLAIVYVLIFATLLVKCLFLLALHSGIYLNSAYQGILIFFAVGVQVAISSQWLAYRPPEIVASDEVPVREVCRVTPLERVQYLSYTMFLLFVVCVSAIRGRSLKENNKEARFIGGATGVLVVLWVAWVAILVIFGRRYEDPAQGFGLVCSSIVVFLLVFVPKAVQLCSSSRKNGSTSGSQTMVFAPSFLHLQPHAVLPAYADGGSTIVKQQSAGADYCRGYTSRFWRYDYPTFYQMEPHGLGSSDRSSQRKSNVSFSGAPLY